MTRKNSVIILLAIILACAIGYILYFHFGPYKRASEESQHLGKKIETSKGLESKMNEEISQLKTTLTEAENELVKKTILIESLQTKMEGLRETISKLETEKETVVTSADQLRKELEESKNRLTTLSQEIQRQEDDYQQKIQGFQGQVVQRNRDIENLRNEARQLHQTIATIEEDRRALNQEASELKRNLQETRSNLQMFSQEIEARKKKLIAMEQTRQALVEQLKEEIQQKEVRISALEEKLTVQFVDKILFNPGNARITDQGREILKRVAEELKKLSGVEICVDGHTDDQPLSKDARAVYIDNLGLSVARAAAVARILRTKGVEPKKLFAAGHSMYRPLASNTTTEGRQQNRRVEIVLVPLR